MRIIVLFFLASFVVQAQQESLRMAYPFLPLAINPADAGVMKVFSAKGVFRKKPLFQNIGGASSSQQLLSIDMPLAKGSWGLGFLGFNTDQSYAFANNKVTATYGTATARAHADTTWTQEQIDDGKAPDGADTNTVATRGLKYNFSFQYVC